MAKNLSVLLLSQSSTRLNALEDSLLDYDGITASRKLLTAGARDPLSEISSIPDLALLDLGEDWEAELYSVSEGSSLRVRPPLIVIGRGDEPEMMRKAMQAGARDYFFSPISEEELIKSLRQIGRDVLLAQRANSGKVTAVINGKGGSGATFLASSLATVTNGGDKKQLASCVIVDMDMQFGDTPVYFDLDSNDNLMQALNSVDSLDSVALEGLLQSHTSGVHVLASKPDQLRSTSTLNPADVSTLLEILSRHHDHVIVDLPRTLDPCSIAALELSDTVLVAMQQSVPHVRDTKYLVGLLRDLGLSNNNIRLVVNRFDKKGGVSMHDLQDVFQEIEIYQVPNDFKRVAFAVNNGVPVTLRWPSAPVSKAVTNIAASIWPAPESAKTGRSFFRRSR